MAMCIKHKYMIECFNSNCDSDIIFTKKDIKVKGDQKYIVCPNCKKTTIVESLIAHTWSKYYKRVK